VSSYERFRSELEQLINKLSLENGSDTPDFLLSSYLIRCLDTFDIITRERDKWKNLK